MSDLPETLPPDTRVAYMRLLMESRPTRRDQLTARVAAYLSHIERAAAESESLDLTAARRLGNAILELIKACPEEHSSHLQAVVAYFLHSDDAEPDFDSPDGFDDDMGVYNAVCEHVGLPELRLTV